MSSYLYIALFVAASEAQSARRISTCCSFEAKPSAQSWAGTSSDDGAASGKEFPTDQGNLWDCEDERGGDKVYDYDS